MVKFLTNFRRIFEKNPFTSIYFRREIANIEEEINKVAYPRLIMKKLSEINPKVEFKYKPYEIRSHFSDYLNVWFSYERDYLKVDKIIRQNCESNIINTRERCIDESCDSLTSNIKNYEFLSYLYKIKDRSFCLRIHFKSEDDEMKVRTIIIGDHPKRSKLDEYLNEKTFYECNIDEIASEINKMILNSEEIIISDYQDCFQK